MLKLLNFFWTGSWHSHNWEDKERRDVLDGFVVVGIHMYCRCKVCGVWKRFKMTE